MPQTAKFLQAGHAKFPQPKLTFSSRTSHPDTAIRTVDIRERTFLERKKGLSLNCMGQVQLRYKKSREFQVHSQQLQCSFPRINLLLPLTFCRAGPYLLPATGKGKTGSYQKLQYFPMLYPSCFRHYQPWPCEGEKSGVIHMKQWSQTIYWKWHSTHKYEISLTLGLLRTTSTCRREFGHPCIFRTMIQPLDNPGEFYRLYQPTAHPSVLLQARKEKEMHPCPRGESWCSRNSKAKFNGLTTVPI